MSYAFAVRHSPPHFTRHVLRSSVRLDAFYPRRPPRYASAARTLTRPRLFSFSRNMASDEDYAAFLDKANQDTGTTASTQTKSFKTKAVDAEVPQVLQQVDEFYISDADEPFEPVSLKWDGDAIPSEGQLAQLIGHKSDASSISQKDFDPQGQYAKVIDAVKQAGSQDVGFFRVEHDSTRAEYYVISLDKKGGRVVGLKAVAVES